MDPTQTDDQAETEAPAEAPFRVRDVFAFRRSKSDDEPDAEEPQDPGQPEAAPEAAPAATIPEQPKTLGIGDRAPNWWDPKPVIAAACQHPNPRTFRMAGHDEPIPWHCPDCDTYLNPDGKASVPSVPGFPVGMPTATKATPSRPAGKACQHPDPHEVRNKVTGQLVAFWCADCETQLDVPDDYDELAEVTDADDEEGDGGEGGDKVPASIRRRWSMRGNGKKTYARPVYGKTSDERKKSGIEAFTQIPRKTRHLLYNGAALGAGFWIGVPQFFTAEVAYLVDTYSSWTDFYVCVWYGVAVGIWVIDHRTRNWFPPFALAARIPLVSMIVGVLLYGNPAA
ncbi:hypothetical protein ACFWXA_13220 [Streptomyces atroolivaceus]|uniref:hypothetical protein n=1 Tax=Streptomyces atroolivaceus TaxID=66869 RepID=UPI0036462505